MKKKLVLIMALLLTVSAGSGCASLGSSSTSGQQPGRPGGRGKFRKYSRYRRNEPVGIC